MGSSENEKRKLMENTKAGGLRANSDDDTDSQHIRHSLPAIPKETDGQRERRDRARADGRERDKRDAAARINECVRLAGKSIGRRYSGCTMENFECKTPAQKKVLSSIVKYASKIKSGKCPRNGIVLFGPVGTGKDHLLSAMMMKAAAQGLSVRWINGMDLFAKYRDMISSDQTEEELLREFTVPMALYISDPIPPRGDLTSAQMNFLFRIIDRRYRDVTPIWCTMNALSSNDASDRMSAQLVDRLKQDALCLQCDWPSYRQASTVAQRSGG